MFRAPGEVGIMGLLAQAEGAGCLSRVTPGGPRNEYEL